jgi:D-alanyl-D-alanine carboxypeptidase/D-alanyl-D-alanine-endopeptidase (penicillin-binding protein 4)
LRQRLNDYLAQPKFASAMWGVKVVSLDTGKLVFEHNPQKLLTPASNSKLYTVALALARFGPGYRIKTSLLAASKPDATGTIPGDLIVYGRGDPAINARLHGGDIFQALNGLVAVLTNAGVKRITGGLVGDESYFRGPPFGSGWAWDDLDYSYGAEVSALSINDNVLQLTVRPGEHSGEPCRLALSPAITLITFSNRTVTVEKGRPRTIHFYHPNNNNLVQVLGEMPVDDVGALEDVPMHKPAALFVTLWQEALARRGITIEGRPRTMDWLDRQAAPTVQSPLTELGSVVSPPLSELAKEIMKPSQNLYADLLLAHTGEKARLPATPGDETSESLGLRELEKFLGRAGVPPGEALFEEGSGLSRNNLATANATVALLQYMARQPFAAEYLEALPIAGVDGTLHNRMNGTAAQGNLRAKTGTLKWASSLSGHVRTAAGERLVFSIMLNRYHATDSSRPARAEVDAIGVMLAEFKGRSDEPTGSGSRQ